jgi:hypothetical protein
MVIQLPIKRETLLKLYYKDKVWEEGMPLYEGLKEDTKMYLSESYCFALFVNSQRAQDLHILMLELNN